MLLDDVVDSPGRAFMLLDSVADLLSEDLCCWTMSMTSQVAPLFRMIVTMTKKVMQTG